ncbi:MAG: class I SAM-dependent methyltransferase [Devosia sp.]
MNQQDAVISPGNAQLAALYAKDIVRSLVRIPLRRIRRTAGKVASEYDGGFWSDVAREQRWLRHDDLKTYLAGSQERQIVCRLEGKVVRTTEREYYARRVDALSALIVRMRGADATGGIVELGCGYGLNLFSLAATGQFDGTNLLGLDISPVGIATGETIAAHFQLANVGFDRLDLTDASDPNFARLAGNTCFTYFAIEQIPRHVEQAVDNILRAGPRRVIHVEPTAEMLDLRRPRDWVSLAYIRSVDYQSRLFGYLTELEGRGAIRILERGRNSFSPTIRNDGFIAVWEPA